MNIAIGTIAMLVGIVALILGGCLLLAAFGSDNEAAGAEASRQGCLLGLGGAGLIGFGVWMVL